MNKGKKKARTPIIYLVLILGAISYQWQFIGFDDPSFLLVLLIVLAPFLNLGIFVEFRAALRREGLPRVSWRSLQNAIRFEELYGLHVELLKNELSKSPEPTIDQALSSFLQCRSGNKFQGTRKKDRYWRTVWAVYILAFIAALLWLRWTTRDYLFLAFIVLFVATAAYLVFVSYGSWIRQFSADAERLGLPPVPRRRMAEAMKYYKRFEYDPRPLRLAWRREAPNLKAAFDLALTWSRVEAERLIAESEEAADDRGEPPRPA